MGRQQWWHAAVISNAMYAATSKYPRTSAGRGESFSHMVTSSVWEAGSHDCAEEGEDTTPPDEVLDSYLVSP